MGDLSKRERSAMEVVAREFATTWEASGDTADAYIKVAGKPVAVAVATLEERAAGQGRAGGPRLRFDKEVIRLVGGLEAALNETVPNRTTVLVTVTAPIWLGSKTGAALEEKIRTLLGRRSPGRDWKGTIHGNRVRIRILREESRLAPKMIGFVHNSDSDPLLLLNMTGELLQAVSAAAAKRTRRPAGDRWLVLISARRISCLQAYRYIYSQLQLPTKFKKVLMVFSEGRVGTLAG